MGAGWVQGGAVAVCVLLGLALIANTQMEGEASWFWYAVLLQHGVRLYRDLHLALQPLFVLETDGWMRLFGGSAVGMGVKSLLHVGIFSWGLLLVIRRVAWPEWMRGLLLVTTFAVSLQAPGFRFDDYHVLAQSCIVFSLALLLRLEAASEGEAVWLAGGLGCLCGLALTTRLNDGAALLVADLVCVAVLAQARRVRAVVLVGVVAGLTVAGVVLLTGDGVGAYLSNSVLHVSASKGGTGSVARAPLILFREALKQQEVAGRRVLLGLGAALLAGWPVVRLVRRWPVGSAVLLQLVVAGGLMMVSRPVDKKELMEGALIIDISMLAILGAYVLAPVVLGRWLAAGMGRLRGWNRREVLLVLPLAEMASASASTAGQPFQGFYLQTALCVVLILLLFPAGRWSKWGVASLTSLLVLLGMSGVVSKYREPYTWQKYTMARMFTNRVWYRSPSHGPLYIERDQLTMSRPICAAIAGGSGQKELLSLPYSYPNYFCGIAPWHGYVQTYFDTTTRATMDALIRQLETAPPEWIEYQRQMEVLRGQEVTYNHGQPLGQRALDAVIMSRIQSGQWHVVTTSDYLHTDGGWMLIRTGP